MYGMLKFLEILGYLEIPKFLKFPKKFVKRFNLVYISNVNKKYLVNIKMTRNFL